MTLEEALQQAYAWGELNAQALLIGAVLVPVLGTVLARVGKAGRTDADGRFVASAVAGIGLLAVVAELGAILLAQSVFQASVLQANLLLLVAPPVCLAASLVGIRWVFPLSELTSVRTFIDLLLFCLACAALLWAFSKFRGWGVYFFGSFTQLLLIAGLTVWLMRRLFRRTFGSARPPD